MKLKQFVPERSHSGTKIKSVEIGKNLILETYKNKSSKAILRKTINPTDAFWFGLGLYEAEKSKNVVKKDGRLMASKVAFTNKDPKIINHIINTFEQLGIEKSTWKGELQANINHINKEMFEINAPTFWSKQIGINGQKLKHFKYDRRMPKYNKKYEEEFFGIMTIYQYNLCLKSFVDNLIKNIPISQ